MAATCTEFGCETAGESPASLHEPVMVREVLAAATRREGGVFVDATVNGGGHASFLLPELPADNAYVGLDLDAAALERARRRLASYGARVTLFPVSFRTLGKVLEEYAGRVTNVLFDLGLSSDQLADESRGFSFASAGPLNMRFDGDVSALTAAEVVNTFDETRLADLLYEWGEERRSRPIARAIVRWRQEAPLRTAAELAEVVSRAVGRRRGRLHPATRTFLALRAFVNDEYAALAEALPAAAALLAAGGRLLVIAYHSFEDRLVKRYFRESSASGALHVLTRKPQRPTPDEVRRNPRSRSARLRAAEKL